MSTFKKLKDGISQHRSAKIHVTVALLQFLIALGLMIPVLMSVSDMFIYYYINRRIVSESIFYILFEAFRLWLVLDSIIQMNALTIYVTGALAAYVFVSSIVSLAVFLVSDSKDMIPDPRLLEYYGYSKYNSDLTVALEFDKIDRPIQIAFSSSLLVLTLPALWAAYKLSKDFNWGVYRKIGADMDVQKRYRIIQVFSIMLKLDFFFEFIYLQVLGIAAGSWAQSVLIVITYFVTLISLPIAKEAVARESRILMNLFLCMQVEYLAGLVSFLVVPNSWIGSGSIASMIFGHWIVLAICLICSIICCLITIILGIWCQVNFNKGLKEHAQWSFFGLRKALRSKTEQDKIGHSDGLLSTKIDMPIDED